MRNVLILVALTDLLIVNYGEDVPDDSELFRLIEAGVEKHYHTDDRELLSQSIMDDLKDLQAEFLMRVKAGIQ